MIDSWIREVKESCDPAQLGMILMHNGVVRGTSKGGKPVRKLKLTHDRDKLMACIAEMKKRDGIVDVRAWINEGILRIGDDIMYVLVAGRFRTDVLPALQELLTFIKTAVVSEEEVLE